MLDQNQLSRLAARARAAGHTAESIFAAAARSGSLRMRQLGEYMRDPGAGKWDGGTVSYVSSCSNPVIVTGPAFAGLEDEGT